MIQLDQITIPEHVFGYPGVAFGGYVAGVLAAHSPAETLRVDFRGAVPVGTPLTRTGTARGGLALTDADGAVLTEAHPATLDLDVPDCPPRAEVEAATDRALRSTRRPYTHCYGCGQGCPPGRGLRLFPAPLRERGLVVSAWTPDPALAGPDGTVGRENVWAAMDCPGGWVGFTLTGMRQGSVTAALTTTLLAPVEAGAPHISYAWPLAVEGRKHTVGVALATSSGELCAVAEALWIEPREPSPHPLP
ncbi:hypothetical protein [Nocardia farcinica]|uniref:hypothetical protein n=1 Tax=Nocardia farcinica TaxID=37329 RepID=UPI001895512B|nr:hypothetical protein [Nocardia farcinica]MBF6290438.1 hypothetical protein [Nocardia farcinica]MBF6377611.1 hypothetical protein [Nocardia farcinica]